MDSNIECNLLDIIKEKCAEGLIVQVYGYLDSPLEIAKVTKNKLFFLMKRTCHNQTYIEFTLHAIKDGLKMNIEHWTSDADYTTGNFKLAWTLSKLLMLPVNLEGYNFVGENDYDFYRISRQYQETVLEPMFNEQRVLRKQMHREALSSFD